MELLTTFLYILFILSAIVQPNFWWLLGLLLSAVLMLRHIDEGAAADRIMAALHTVLEEGTSLTRDLGGTASTFWTHPSPAA